MRCFVSCVSGKMALFGCRAPYPVSPSLASDPQILRSILERGAPLPPSFDPVSVGLCRGFGFRISRTVHSEVVCCVIIGWGPRSHLFCGLAIRYLLCFSGSCICQSFASDSLIDAPYRPSFEWRASIFDAFLLN